MLWTRFMTGSAALVIVGFPAIRVSFQGQRRTSSHHGRFSFGFGLWDKELARLLSDFLIAMVLKTNHLTAAHTGAPNGAGLDALQKREHA